MLIAILTLSAVGIGYGLFRLGRWYENRRLSDLIEWACQLSEEVGMSMDILEASQRQAEAEERVH